MNISMPKEFTASKIRRDAATVITMSVIAAVALISLAINRFFETFTPDGVAWTLPVEPQSVTAEGLTLYTPSGPSPMAEITGTFSSLQVIVGNVNLVSSICLGAAIVIASLAGLIVIFCTATLAWQFLRGQFFTPRSSFTVRVLTWAIASGAGLSYIAWFFGSNGVAAALGVRAADTANAAWWGWYALAMFVVISIGLLDIALRRAVRMQRDHEGLV